MIVAHDLGTSGDKASLHDRSGRLVASCTVGYPTRFAAGGVAEQDPRHWERAVAEATRQLVARAQVAGTAVTGVVLSGQMMSAVFLDGRGEPLRPAFIWTDDRSTAQADRLRDALGADRAYALLGHRVHGTYPLPKLRRSIVDAATSLGAAVTGLVALGDADFPLARQLSEVTAAFEPDPERAAAYARLAGWPAAGFPAGTTAQEDR